MIPRSPVWARLLGALLVLLHFGGHATSAQDAPTAERGVELARFDDAQALAVDPRERLYVADAGRDVVEILSAEGEQLDVIGGAGTWAGAFNLPSDVDPTNGQVLLVADTYNGRVQRFSEEGQYLESLPIGRTDRGEGEGWAVENQRAGGAVRGDGRPVAVARDDEGAVFVLDRYHRRLLKWTDIGYSERIVSGRRGRLQNPVALAVGDAGRVYVADNEKEAVLIYDSVGTLRARVPVPSLPSLRAITVHQGRLWIVGANRVLVWAQGKGVVMRREVHASAPLVDVAPFGQHVYLLTEARLLRRPGW